MIKKVFIIIGAIGFVLALGTAGASDMEAISFGEIAIKMIASMLLIGISVAGIKRCNRQVELADRPIIKVDTDEGNEYKFCG